MRLTPLIVALALLAGCGGGEPRLLNLSTPGEGPDEFRILPTKPLELPQESAALPPPAPGGRNLADPTPEADVYAALGGNPAVLGRPVDGGIVNYATRLGVAPAIRPELAAADREFRRRNDGLLLERIFGVNTYFDAYARQSLDQYAELERFRRAGIRTPAAPPEGTEPQLVVRPPDAPAPR
ncbi:DUF3035 domain-containing protein [Roseitranquillus sediminis]|uniref:DUF3035 domain-containing protein n=1 Tax=Roseitranquillus sediminis TaxID=2809051 RepID=UPI001D0C5D64|nr:DUF3035 domain-containing protein [Roseitranquillus sediminis]MBM9593671.1 DUF3035 domain-containing protein [Roseitranquillus sediminis]